MSKNVKLLFSELTGDVYNTKKDKIENILDILVMLLIFHNGVIEFKNFKITLTKKDQWHG